MFFENFFLLKLSFILYWKISITWPDEHASEYEAEWLKKRCFSEEARAEMREDLFLPGRSLNPMCRACFRCEGSDTHSPSLASLRWGPGLPNWSSDSSSWCSVPGWTRGNSFPLLGLGIHGCSLSLLTPAPDRSSADWAAFAFLKAFSFQKGLVGLKNEPCGPAVGCVTMQVCVCCLNS